MMTTSCARTACDGEERHVGTTPRTSRRGTPAIDGLAAQPTKPLLPGFTGLAAYQAARWKDQIDSGSLQSSDHNYKNLHGMPL
ncbi:MAG: hypothetical protein IH897_06195 [Planctomycetes bacterium]|nr:hypothetical protein [Planctomycetota bacterium]